MKRSRHAQRIALGLLAVLALALAGCGDLEDVFDGDALNIEEHEATRSGVTEVDLDGAQVMTLVVQSEVGKVTIEPGDDRAMVVEYTLTAYGETDAEAESELAEMEVSVVLDGDRVVVNSFQTADDGDSRSDTVDLVIAVPEEVNLNVSNHVGDIRIQDVTAPSMLKVAQNVGEIELEDVSTGAAVDLHSDVGEIRFSGSLDPSQEHVISTETGEITVELPAGTSGELDAAASVGQIEIEGFTISGLSHEREGAQSALRGTLGAGGETISLRTSVGDITIAQA